MTEVKVTVADLINGELLKPGTVVVLRTLEGVITDQGTIRAAGANGLGVVDYRTPTAWSRVVCKINSSGWRQVKLKDEKTSLYTLKQKYIQRKGGDAKEDKPAKRQKTPNKAHVPNTNHIPQQLQFIPHPLQQQLAQQQVLALPIPLVTPPKPVMLAQAVQEGDPNAAASAAMVSPPTTSASSVSQVPQPVVIETPPPAQSSYMKFKLAPPTTKTKMLELLVYIEDPTMIPFMLNTTASSFDSLHYVLLESFPQYRQKQFGIHIGVWSDQWGEFVKPPPNWDQFPAKTKIIVKTFPFRWNAREYEPPSTPNSSATPAAPGTPTGNGAPVPVGATSSPSQQQQQQHQQQQQQQQPSGVPSAVGPGALPPHVHAHAHAHAQGVVGAQAVAALAHAHAQAGLGVAQGGMVGVAEQGTPPTVVSIPMPTAGAPLSPTQTYVTEATATPTS